jgi:AraC family transcriptional regulator of adaptative response / DNA-3-methyladenine glycosylase II
MRDSITSKQSISPALDRDSCYRALVARDSRFDGAFFTGVNTTGIYCRPVCPAKTPRESSCTFFSNAAAAEAAGFRPCLRCRPELAPYPLQQNLADAVWHSIAAGALNDGDVESLAAEIGLSSRQMRRLLLQHFGVTPVELAQTQRLLFAKKLLQETNLTMTELALSSGFGSVRRFNALFAARYAIAPMAIRRATTTSGFDDADGLTLRLAYRPPFAWSAMLRYLDGRAMPGVEKIELSGAKSFYARSIRIKDSSGWLRVSHHASKKQLEVRVAPRLAPVLMPLLAQVRKQFDLDANPTVIQAHLMHDPLLSNRIKATPGLRVPGAFDNFELAVRAVLGQQISVAGATTMSGRLIARFGQRVDTPFSGITHHFPSAQQLAGACVADIAAIGLPSKRAGTIRNLAQFAVNEGLNLKPGTMLDEAVERMKTVRGIGEWTAQYIALRALRFPDAFPAGDLGLQKAAAGPDTPHARLTEKQLQARAASWVPWRAYAALLLWQTP